MTTQPIADCFDRECCELKASGAAPSDELDELSASFLGALRDAGFTAGTVLELGSGRGEFSRALLRHGAAAVDGLDLSPQTVAYATRGAAEADLSDRLTYRVADAATEPLTAHDAVISKKVFCCYPDASRLLANTLPAARTVYALVLPESRGWRGLLGRVAVSVENSWQAVTRDPFRAHVHDLGRLIGEIEAAGFELRVSRAVGGWRLWRALVFSRA